LRYRHPQIDRGGLDPEFNSLDAQRELAEMFIKSILDAGSDHGQAHV